MQSHKPKAARSRRKAPNGAAALVVSPLAAMSMLNIGRTHLYKLLAARDLESYHEGKSRKITVRSIQQRVQRKLQEAAA
jgi:hypothetical protein